MDRTPWILALATATLLLLAGCPPDSGIGNGDDDDGDDDVGDDDVGDDDTGDDDTSDDDTGDDDTEAPVEIPPLSGVTCADAEPNDCDYSESVSDWGDCMQACSGVVSSGGDADLLSGTIETVVNESWDGDNDTFALTINADGFVHAVLDWDDPAGDLDLTFYCYYGDEENPANWYVLMIDTNMLDKPEQGTSVIPLPAGTACYAWVAGYQAGDGEPYTLHLWMTDP